MKKGVLGILLVMIISCIFSACNNQKSLQELLQEEQKAIDKFIKANNLVILKDYPADSVFKDNEYFRTSDGLFFHVVSPGNGKQVQLLDEVYVRYDYFQLVKDAASGDTTKYAFPFTPAYVLSGGGYPIASGGQPYSFVYGIAATYSTSPISQSWVAPLSYVSENAIVDMIIPSTVGSASYEYNNVIPVFYKNLHYTRFN